MCKLQIVFLGLLVTKGDLFLKSGKAIPSTMKEHHAVLLPWRASCDSGLTLFASLVTCVCVCVPRVWDKKMCD